MSGVDEALVTSAVVALLRDQLPAGVLVGDGGTPYRSGDRDPVGTIDPAVGEVFPWVVVYCIDPGVVELTPGYIGQDGAALVRFQLTGAGPEREAAQGAAITARGILVDREDELPYSYIHDLVVAGHAVMDRRKAGQGTAAEEGGWWNAPVMVDVMVHRTA